MTSSASVVAILWRRALSARLPGMMALTPSLSAEAPSSVSRRRSPLRVFLSKPWQRKQASARMGRMSRLYSG